jgi:hypothetical protein
MVSRQQTNSISSNGNFSIDYCRVPEMKSTKQTPDDAQYPGAYANASVLSLSTSPQDCCGNTTSLSG